MKTMYLGEVVRRQRNTLGVTQKMVCDGLCAEMTLSRFESGRQTPSWDCVLAILQRLGLTYDRYYAHLTREEMRIERLKKEVRAYCVQFEHALGAERQQARINGLKKLQEFEDYIKKDDHINRQFIIGIKVTLAEYSPQKQLEMLMEAIHLTSPRFNLDELDRCLYSTDEIIIISKIALRYALCEQRGKAIDIYEQLLKLVLKRNPESNHLFLIAYNYALYLALEKRWEDALEISNLGRQACIKHKIYGLFPRFLHIEAECYYLMGELGKSAELYRSAYHFYAAIMDASNQETLKLDAKERFNLIF